VSYSSGPDEEFLSVEQSSVTLVFEPGTTAVSYSNRGIQGGDFLPLVQLGPTPVRIDVDGVSGRDLDGQFENTLYFGRLDWSGGTSYVMDLIQDPRSGSIGYDNFFVLGGVSLPTFDTVSEFEAFFMENEDNFSEIPRGEPFGQGSTIDLTVIPDVEVSGDVLAPPAPTPGDDNLVGSDEAEVIDALEGNDSVIALGGDDEVLGNFGDDELSGGAGNDTLDGGAGNDRLNGNSGADVMRGGDGDDIYYVDAPGDRIVESSGRDIVYTDIDFRLQGTGAEVLLSSSDSGASLRLVGSTGNDVITSGNGSDVLIGLGGDDVMTGSVGADDFVLFSRSGPTTIDVVDFDRTEFDRLAIDDQLIGMGDRSVDVRGIAGAEALGLLRSGVVSYDFGSGTLTIDTDLDGVVDATAMLAAGRGLSVEDVLIF
jgi:hypothetical protein